tara:strand:+ start:256 stop:459 length:204 start_codon:yes stop_codon:yes gene_type:complete
MSEEYKIVTVCDGDTWGDYDHATVLVYPEEWSIDWECDIRPDDVEYKEYDLEEYIEMRIAHWVEENM